jgi:hypothetical protein
MQVTVPLVSPMHHVMPMDIVNVTCSGLVKIVLSTKVLVPHDVKLDVQAQKHVTASRV